MTWKLQDQKELWIGMIAYIAGFTLSRLSFHILAGTLMLFAALIVYLIRWRTVGSLVDLFGFFSLSWMGGQGLACFQLSALQKDWNRITWLCFFLAYVGVYLGMFCKNQHKNRITEPKVRRCRETAGRLLICCIVLAVSSVICFLVEAVICGFIPFFSDKPHAYSTFHVSGVHYFTISCILIPAITVIYSKVETEFRKSRAALLLMCNCTAVLIPILCVSRFQLLFAVGFAAVTYLLLYRKVTLKMVLILMMVMVPMYVVLTVARNHDVAYLNGIFEMKNRSTPIFITQPYMYVVNNFENFNCMVEQLTVHSYGLRMLFPVFALTGMKFVFPQLVNWPLFLTKQELTTLTMFYDAYYDFGVWGVILLGVVIGMAVRLLMKWVHERENPVICLFYGQMAIYMGLAFFTTWFSVPTTWFWFVLTGMMYVFVGYKKKEQRK